MPFAKPKKSVKGCLVFAVLLRIKKMKKQRRDIYSRTAMDMVYMFSSVFMITEPSCQLECRPTSQSCFDLVNLGDLTTNILRNGPFR